MIPKIIADKFIQNYDKTILFLKQKEEIYRKYLEENYNFKDTGADILDFSNDINTKEIDFNSDIIRIGKKEEISDTQRILLEEILKKFIPWRKGPFSIFGIDIDAEWRSDYKR